MNNKNEKETAIDLMDDKETYLYIRKGLLLLGWNTEPRLTNEDKAILLEVCKELKNKIEIIMIIIHK